MDPRNEVIGLCVAGMAAEAAGDPARARELFERAWAAAGDDYERCVAAHYVARHQDTPADTLRWNEDCLRYADAVGDDRVAGFYASLHLNIARARRDLGDHELAGTHLARAAEHLPAVPEGEYRNWLRLAVADGRRAAAGPPGPGHAALDALIERWCERRRLTALALVLPAHLGDLGTSEDAERLVTTLRMVHATDRLPAAERAEVGRVIAALTAPEPLDAGRG
ncbi:hypothetical protein [Streptomyces mayteni]